MASLLNARNLGDLNKGNAEILINSCIEKAIADLDDRGEQDKKTRKVTIVLEMSIHDGLVHAEVHAHPTLPPYKSGLTLMEIKQREGKPVAEFQPLSPGNPSQPSFKIEPDNA